VYELFLKLGYPGRELNRTYLEFMKKKEEDKTIEIGFMVFCDRKSSFPSPL